MYLALLGKKRSQLLSSQMGVPYRSQRCRKYNNNNRISTTTIRRSTAIRRTITTTRETTTIRATTQLEQSSQLTPIVANKKEAKPKSSRPFLLLELVLLSQLFCLS